MNKKIETLNCKLIQAPTIENGLSAIVQIESIDDNYSISDFGYANAEVVNSNDQNSIIETARENALNRINMQKSKRSSMPLEYEYPENNQLEHTYKRHFNQLSNKATEEKSYKHSTSHLASEKQLALLEKLASTKGGLEQCSMQIMGKYPDELTSSDANELIKALKK